MLSLLFLMHMQDPVHSKFLVKEAIQPFMAMGPYTLLQSTLHVLTCMSVHPAQSTLHASTCMSARCLCRTPCTASSL